MMNDKATKMKVLEDLITAMEDRESGAKIKGAKPLLQIMIAAAEGPEGPEREDPEDMQEGGEMPEGAMPEEMGAEMPMDGEGMPPEFMAMLAQKKREKR